MNAAVLTASVGIAADSVPIRDGDRRASRWFVHLCLVFSICLQRFCIFVGGGAVYWCLFVFLAGLIWLLATGRARIRPMRAVGFGVFGAAALLSTVLAIAVPDPRIGGASLPSLASILLVYVGLIVVPGDRFDGSGVFDILVRYIRLCAILGLVQYGAQFAGWKAFAFLDLMPSLRPVLVEPLFNYHPVVSYGSSIMRSNGFFLVEPSIFSQLLVLGVVVDVFVRRDWRFLPLYGGAYLVTYAGTGLLALGIAGTLSVLIAPRSSPRLFGLGLGLALLAGLAAVAAPDIFAALGGRATELNQSGSSGYARYVAQFELIDAFGGETRTLFGYGPGTLERANISVAGSINAALKLFFEYGILGLTAFAVFLVGALWQRDIALVSLFLLVNFQFGGGYVLFMPFVVLSALLCIWSAPQPRPAR